MKQQLKKASPTDRVAFTVRIPRALHDELRLTSLRKRVTLQQLAEQRLRHRAQSKRSDLSWLDKIRVKGPGKEHYSRADYYEEYFEHKFGALGQ